MVRRLVTWGCLVVVACAGAMACSGGSSGQKRQASGTGGSGAASAQAGAGGDSGGPAGTGGQVGTGGAAATGGVGGGASATGGISGVAGGAGSGGQNGGSGGAAPDQSGAAGRSESNGGAGGGGTGATAGHTGLAGIAGAGGGGDLAGGTAQLDLTITLGGQSTHVTGCAGDDPHAAVVVEYPNGDRTATIHCFPTPDGTLALYDLSIVPQLGGLGTHDASELVFDCPLTAAGCMGVADVDIHLSNGTLFEAYQTTMKAGTFTLDQFTAGGYMSGSLNLSMTVSGMTVTIQGTFAATLHDCGAAGGGFTDVCTGQAG